MKFDFVIGNPPFNETTEVNNRSGALYPLFYDEAKTLTDKYLLISPARFLFNAGLTSKEWNKKMLSDPHLKVEYFNKVSGEVFANTDIKGGVAIIYRDATQNFGAIEEFIPDENLRNLLSEIKKTDYVPMTNIMYGGRSDLKFNELYLQHYPNTKEDRLKAIQKKHPKVLKLGVNEEYELKSPTLDILDYTFYNEEPKNKEDYYKLLGLVGKERVYRWIERKFMTPRYDDNNINHYKVFIPKAIGSGRFGEVMSTAVAAEPGTSSTPTFISIGKFNTIEEAENTIKYTKTKFARALLGVLKITQDNIPSKWKYVPVQNFTNSSDIDWGKSISDIDKQLYKKYKLKQKEIDFIEENVKEMK